MTQRNSELIEKNQESDIQDSNKILILIISVIIVSILGIVSITILARYISAQIKKVKARVAHLTPATPKSRWLNSESTFKNLGERIDPVLEPMVKINMKN